MFGHQNLVTQEQSYMECNVFLRDKGCPEEIKNILEKRTQQVFISQLYVKYVKKGGRISPAAAAIGTVLNLMPVLSAEQGKK